jgi:hypothetical protein
MAHHVTDRDSLLKAIAPLRDGLFLGTELAYDEKSRTLTLSLTCPDGAAAGGGRGFFLRPGKNSYRRHAIQVRRIVSYKQYLAAGPDEVYVLDRAEVGRGGQELAFYFRPGDRAVMDVEQIDVRVEDAGRATAPPRKPGVVNPLLAKEKARRR